MNVVYGIRQWWGKDTIPPNTMHYQLKNEKKHDFIGTVICKNYIEVGIYVIQE